MAKITHRKKLIDIMLNRFNLPSINQISGATKQRYNTVINKTHSHIWVTFPIRSFYKFSFILLQFVVRFWSTIWMYCIIRIKLIIAYRFIPEHRCVYLKCWVKRLFKHFIFFIFYFNRVLKPLPAIKFAVIFLCTSSDS